MRTSSILGLVLLLAIGASSVISAENAATTPPAPTGDDYASKYKTLPKDQYGAIEYTITKGDMMLNNWIVELNSSAANLVNRRNSYTKGVRHYEQKNRTFLGVRVMFPTHNYNAFARVAPTYQLPAFDARGFPINYGFFDPQAKDINPFNKGGSTGPDDSYSTYSAVPRVPGIKTLIDFNDYESMINNVVGYVNKRYLGNLAGKAAEVGYDEGMPIIGFPLDPNGEVDTKKMMHLSEIGNLFAEKDATRDGDAYAAAINSARGTAPAAAPAAGATAEAKKAPSRKEVEDALVALEAIGGKGGTTGTPGAAISTEISYNGVIHNVGALKEIVIRVAGRNYRNGIALRLRNQNEEISEYFLGYLDFTGWQYRRWVNPNYLPAEEAEAFRLPLYPADIPYIAFDSFVIYRNGTELGGDFVTYIDWVKVDYDLAVPPAQLQLTNGFVDIDDEGWWKILRERNSKKTESLMRKFSADLDLRRQQLGRSVRRAEGVAPVETSDFKARNEYTPAAPAAAATTTTPR